MRRLPAPDQRLNMLFSATLAQRVLELAFADGRAFRLPYEFLRVYSPSAEVRGHGSSSSSRSSWHCGQPPIAVIFFTPTVPPSAL